MLKIIVFILVWVVLSISVEIIMAILFGFKAKKQLIFILIVNIIMRVLLLAWTYEIINAAKPHVNGLIILVAFIFGGLIESCIELILYLIWLNKLSGKPRQKLRTLGYVIVANYLSFVTFIQLMKLLINYF